MRISTYLKRFSRVRGLVAAIALAATTSVSAQELRVLDNLVNDLTGSEYSIWGFAISSNGRYVTGQALNHTTGFTGVFVYDLDTNGYVVEDAANELGGCMLGVTDEGVAVGYNPNAITLSIDGTRVALETPDPNEGESAARAVSSDGQVVAGDYWTFDTYRPHACIWKDGKMITLPEPTADEVGFNVHGTQATACSGDGSVIAGYIVDDWATFPLVVWRLQDDGTYVCDPICKDYFGRYDEDTSVRPYTLFRTTGLSGDGRYAAVNVAKDYSESRMARFDLTTGELTEYVIDGTGVLSAGTAATPIAIANDGTMTGSVSLGGNLRSACILFPNMTEPEMLTSRYPGFDEFAEYDYIGLHLLYDITADGKRALGMAYDAAFEYATYILDFEEGAGIGSVAVQGDNAETARYTLEGTRVNAPVKGINIVKKADGSVSKVLVK